MLKHGYSSSEESEDFEKPTFHPPAEPTLRRDYYETDYHDLKASLSSVFALPPRFEFTARTLPRERLPPADLLRAWRRSNSETRVVGLQDVRGMEVKKARRKSCCCEACGGLKLARKFIMVQIPQAESLGKPKVSKLESFVKPLPISPPKQAGKTPHAKTKTLAPLRVLVVPPPQTPRLFQLLEQGKQDLERERELRKQRLARKTHVWARVIPPRPVMLGSQRERQVPKFRPSYSRQCLLEPVLKSSRLLSSTRSTLSTAQTQRPLTKRQELRRLYT